MDSVLNTTGLYIYTDSLSDGEVFELLERHPHLYQHPRLEWRAESYRSGAEVANLDSGLNTTGLYRYTDTLSDEEVFDLLARHPQLDQLPRLEWCAETYRRNQHPHRAAVGTLDEDSWLWVAQFLTPGEVWRLILAVPMLTDFDDLVELTRRYRAENAYICELCQLRTDTMSSLRNHHAMTHVTPSHWLEGAEGAEFSF